jgi:hypothetical protein
MTWKRAGRKPNEPAAIDAIGGTVMKMLLIFALAQMKR